MTEWAVGNKLWDFYYNKSHFVDNHLPSGICKNLFSLNLPFGSLHIKAGLFSLSTCWDERVDDSSFSALGKFDVLCSILAAFLISAHKMPVTPPQF